MFDRTRVLIFVFFVAVICLPLFLDFSSKGHINDPNKEPVSSKIKNSVPSFDRAHFKSNVSRIKDHEVIRAVYQKPFKLSPSKGQYQFEALADPHSTPPSLLRFAAMMAREMKQAKADVTDALELMDKLCRCALATNEEILAVRATCAENARTLARRYPSELSKDLDMLMVKLDKKVKTLLH